ncbi:hypothetical protein [Nocardia brasiliensis]|uniref:hypothetical protein n=1 Tax=Nocardia brasiliensis TaxID=37326 RepID=UPI003D8FD89B
MSTNRSRRRQGDNTLPSVQEIRHALRGKPVDAALCREVRELVQLHRYRRSHPLKSSEIDCRRVELVAQIDRRLDDSPAASPPLRSLAHSSTVGALLDRMAAAAARALDKLVAGGPSDPATRRAWGRVAELEGRYAQLLDTITVSLVS